MELNLLRPLVFIDLETTGTDIVKDRIVQIAVLKIFPDGRELPYSKKINPTITIPIEASKIHGIYDEDVKNENTFAQIANDLVNFLDNSDIAGYNSNKFDIPLLLAEFLRINITFSLEGRKFIDVQTIFHKMEPRTLKAAYKFYCGQDLVGAHDALNDICATYEVLKAQLKVYQNVAYEDKQGISSYPIQNDLDILSDFTLFNLLDPSNKVILNEQGTEVFNFGKYQGEALVDVFTKDPGYYDWIMNKDFSDFTKRAVKQVWKRMNQ